MKGGDFVRNNDNIDSNYNIHNNTDFTNPVNNNDNDNDNDDTQYVVTPKGLAFASLLQCGLINSFDDPRAEGFWIIFSDGMHKHNYVSD